MADEDRPFFSSGSYDSYTDIHPEIESLRIDAELRDIVGDLLNAYHYDEENLPSHIDCENCGHRIKLGWAIEGAINSQETEINEIVSCPGKEYEGRSCVYALSIEGTVSYKDDISKDSDGE